MRQLTDAIRDYFGFSYSEMRGFWVLIALAAGSLLIVPGLKWYLAQDQLSYELDNRDQRTLDSLIAQFRSPKSDPLKTEKNLINYTYFDPNTATLKVFLQNGLPEWLGARIIKYREKGGQFKVRKDLLRIYGFSTSLYTPLEQYIQLPEVVTRPSYRKTSYSGQENEAPVLPARSVKTQLTNLDINQSDSLSLQIIPGIGPVLSSRIVRFRDKLGGIHHLTQLSEVYRLSPEALENLEKYTYVSEEFEVKKININTDDVSTLAQHPYISFPLAKAIVRHRDEYGIFQDLIDCREVYLMDQATFLKIAPYLSL